MSDDGSDNGGIIDVVDGGLIDVTGFSLGHLATLDDVTLDRALDHILTVSDNSVGFHGFNNMI